MNTGTVNLCIDGYGQSRRLNKETVPAGVFNYTFASKSRSFNHKASGNDTFIVDLAAYRLNQYTVLNQAGTIQNPTYGADGNNASIYILLKKAADLIAPAR